MSLPSEVIMVEPWSFYCNPVTSLDNHFQSAAPPSSSSSPDESDLAIEEHRTVVQRLAVEFRVNVTCYRVRDDDEAQPQQWDQKPDAIFPNNSFSIHRCSVGSRARPIGTVMAAVLYPMSQGRQKEIPARLLEYLSCQTSNDDEDDHDDSSSSRLIDLRSLEASEAYLEGTGSMNFSPCGTYVYACRSVRTTDSAMNAFLAAMKPLVPSLRPENVFLMDAVDQAGRPVYHTNVVGWVGTNIACWCRDALRFATPAAEAEFWDHTHRQYPTLLEISLDQMSKFAGNCLEVTNQCGKKVLCMSTTAWSAFTPAQQRVLVSHYYRKETAEKWIAGSSSTTPPVASEEDGCGAIAVFAIPTIEVRGGGSVRCLLASTVFHAP